MNYKITHKNKTYIVKARDASEAVEKVIQKNKEDVQDDRLSPMTYSKLKEMGYGPDDWKKWTQEQANQIVARGKNNNSSTSSGNKQKSKSRSSSSANANSQGTSSSSTQNAKNKLSLANKIFNNYAREDLGGIGQLKEMGYNSLKEYHEDLYGSTEYLPKSLENAKITNFGFVAKAPIDIVKKEIAEKYREAGAEGASDIEFSKDQIYDLGNGNTLVMESPGHDFDRDIVNEFYKKVENVFKNSEKTNKINIEFNNEEPSSSMEPGSKEIRQFYSRRKNKNADILMKNKEVNSIVNSYVEAVNNNKWGSSYPNTNVNVALAEKRASLSTIEKAYEELGGDRMLNTIRSSSEDFSSRSSEDNENAVKLSKYSKSLLSLKETITEMKKLGLSRYKTSLRTLV